MYSTELTECPGCRNACPVDQLTCGIGEKLVAQYRLKEQAKQEENQNKESSPAGQTEPDPI